jgi:putative hydrolase of the HAD superfamily
MIGDNLEWDVAGALGVGVGAVWIDRAGQGVPDEGPARPDRIIRSLTELFPLLESDR